MSGRASYQEPQVPGSSPEGVVLSGYLQKEGGNVKTWKSRFFTLTRAGILSYYTDETLKDLKKSLNCASFALKRLPERSSLHFELDTDVMSGKERKLVLKAPDEATLELWEKTFQNLLANLREGSQANDEYMTGYLCKLGSEVKNWKRRFCILYKDGKMKYFEDQINLKLKGEFSCAFAEVDLMPELGDLHFKIEADIFGEPRTVQLEAYNAEALASWVRAVRVVSCMYGERDPAVPNRAARTNSFVPTKFSGSGSF